MKFGCIKLHLLDPGNSLCDIEFTKARARVPVLPAREERIEEGGLTTFRKERDMWRGYIEVTKRLDEK